jgi:hypothetical protein
MPFASLALLASLDVGRLLPVVDVASLDDVATRLGNGDGNGENSRTYANAGCALLRLQRAVEQPQLPINLKTKLFDVT